MRSGDAVPGGVAQLGERLPCTQEVVGSIPITSTIFHSFYELGGDGMGKAETSLIRIFRRVDTQNLVFANKAKCSLTIEYSLK